MGLRSPALFFPTSFTTDLFTRPQRWAHNTVWVHHRCPISQPQWPLGLDIFYARAGKEKSVTPLGWQVEWMWLQLPVMSPLKRGERKYARELGLPSLVSQMESSCFHAAHLQICTTTFLSVNLFAWISWDDFLPLSVERVPPNTLWILPGLASLLHLPLLFFFFGMFSSRTSMALSLSSFKLD